MTQIVCPICSNSHNNLNFAAKERLLGTREQFQYGECSSCNAVFLLDKIENFTPYYPSDYHCFDDEHYPKRKQKLLKSLYYYNFWGKGLVGSLTSKVFTKLHGHKPEQNICWIAAAAKQILGEINHHNIKELSVLDLGCGSGGLLKQLHSVGMKNLLGVEPFGNPKHKHIEFIRSNIIDFVSQNHTTKYDIIILSHVMEHLYEHQTIMKGLKKLLSDRGVLVVAMPFTGKLFSKYREFWLSLDAPRHVIIHSISSFDNLIQESGLQKIDMWHEQKGRDIFASEMYSRDIGFGEINQLGLKDLDRKKHETIADVYNKQQAGGSSVTFFITH